MIRTRRNLFLLLLSLGFGIPLGYARETFNLHTATVADIQKAMDAGALTSERLTGLYLSRIKAYDKRGPSINAFITLNEEALEEARALDRERAQSGPRSILHGVPVVFKDLIDVAGLPTSAGFSPFGFPIPRRDATIVDRLREAGCVMLGKVSTYNWFGDGFDETHPIGPTLNPYNLGFHPGATSNGSGASIAASLAHLAIGTDTSSSVQGPCADSSVAGMVGSPGMVSRAGIIPRGAIQDRPGPMARNLFDVAALFSVIAGWDAEDLLTFQAMGHHPKKDWTAELEGARLNGLRIGVLREMIYEGTAHREGRHLFDRALDDLAQAGAFILDPIRVGIDLKEETLSAEMRLAEHEKLAYTNAYLGRYGPDGPWESIEACMREIGYDKFSPRMVAALDLPDPDKSPNYLNRYRYRIDMRELIMDTMDRLGLDVMVLPYRTIGPNPVNGPRIEENTNNITSNLGLPAVIVPGGYTRDRNLPIGIQFFGREFDDLKILKAAYAFEQVSHRRKEPGTTPVLPGEVFQF